MVGVLNPSLEKPQAGPSPGVAGSYSASESAGQHSGQAFLEPKSVSQRPAPERRSGLVPGTQTDEIART